MSFSFLKPKYRDINATEDFWTMNMPNLPSKTLII